MHAFVGAAVCLARWRLPSVLPSSLPCPTELVRSVVRDWGLSLDRSYRFVVVRHVSDSVALCVCLRACLLPSLLPSLLGLDSDTERSHPVELLFFRCSSVARAGGGATCGPHPLCTGDSGQYLLADSGWPLPTGSLFCLHLYPKLPPGPHLVVVSPRYATTCLGGRTCIHSVGQSLDSTIFRHS